MGALPSERKADGGKGLPGRKLLFALLYQNPFKTRQLSCFDSANGALDSYETHRRAKRGGSH